MRIAIGADHGGYELKPVLVAHLEGMGLEVTDVGAHHLEPTDDYPDFAAMVAEAVAGGRADRGIVVCGSGVGACIAANKIPGVRASVCHDPYSAHQGVEHDDMNVLCLGARIIGAELAKELVGIFVTAKFSGEGRHLRRVAKVRAMEETGCKPGTPNRGGQPRRAVHRGTAPRKHENPASSAKLPQLGACATQKWPL